MRAFLLTIAFVALSTAEFELVVFSSLDCVLDSGSFTLILPDGLELGGVLPSFIEPFFPQGCVNQDNLQSLEGDKVGGVDLDKGYPGGLINNVSGIYDGCIATFYSDE